MIKTEIIGCSGQLTLQRRAQLNAMDTAMVDEMLSILETWRKNRQVKYVILKSSSPKAFCAGGDMKTIYNLYQEGRHDEVIDFFKKEYLLDSLMKRYNKSIISLINGFCFGGGMGISTYTTLRIGGPNAQLAMPEVKINYFPDVGAGYRLSRLYPRGLGNYLALTGDSIFTNDSHACNLLTHSTYCEESYLAIEKFLCQGNSYQKILKYLKPFVKRPKLSSQLGHVSEHFKKLDLPIILSSLKNCKNEVCKKVHKQLLSLCEKSLNLTIETLRYGARHTLRQTLNNDELLAKKAIYEYNAIAGVKKVLIDKVRT